MIVIYHRLFQKDINAGVAYYDLEGGRSLGDRFFDAVEETRDRVLKNPTAFHLVTETLRRAQLRRFPYHFLFEGSEYRVRFLILRHDKRHPSYGIRRR